MAGVSAVWHRGPCRITISAEPRALDHTGADGSSAVLANSQLNAGAKINGCGVFDMENSTRLSLTRFGGRMYDERPHRHDTTRRGHTLNRRDDAGQLLDFFVRQYPTDMTAREDPEWAVGMSGIVEMDTERDHRR